MTNEEIKKILELHKKWLNNEEGGVRADLSGANLRGADLEGAILSGAILDEKEKHRLGVVLSKAKIGYKKLAYGIICKLSIPKGAIVFCINGSKCRTNKCSVLEGEGVSDHDKKTKYKVGKKLEIKDFDLMYNIECSTGIHFFWTIEEARNY